MACSAWTTSKPRRASTCHGRSSAISPARSKPTCRSTTTAPPSREYGFVPRVLVDVSKRSQQTSLFGRTYAAPFGIAPMGITALSAYRGDLVLAQAAARRERPDGHERLVAHQAGGGARRPTRPPGSRPMCRGTSAHHGAHRACRARRIRDPGGHCRLAGRRQSREQHPRRIFHAVAADTAPRLGRHHAPALAARHVRCARCCARHAAFREQRRRRAARRSSRRNVVRDYSDRGQPELGALRTDPPAVEGPAGDQGHPRRGRCAHRARDRRRRHHRVEPRRPAARRRGVAAARAAGDRRGVPGHSGDDGQRRSPRHRRAEGAGARCASSYSSGGRSTTRRRSAGEAGVTPRHRTAVERDPSRHGDARRDAHRGAESRACCFG